MSTINVTFNVENIIVMFNEALSARKLARDIEQSVAEAAVINANERDVGITIASGYVDVYSNVAIQRLQNSDFYDVKVTRDEPRLNRHHVHFMHVEGPSRCQWNVNTDVYSKVLQTLSKKNHSPAYVPPMVTFDPDVFTSMWIPMNAHGELYDDRILIKEPGGTWR
jgi:hypothetical protein